LSYKAGETIDAKKNKKNGLGGLGDQAEGNGTGGQNKDRKN